MSQSETAEETAGLEENTGKVWSESWSRCAEIQCSGCQVYDGQQQQENNDDGGK
jgi:hypothetical protein